MMQWFSPTTKVISVFGKKDDWFAACLLIINHVYKCFYKRDTDVDK